MNKKTVYIVVAVIAVILVVSVAGIVLLNNGNGKTDSTPTPTPPPLVPVSEAASIQFNVDETTTVSGDLVIYQFACKNLNTANETVRVDMDLGADGKFSYIIDTGVEKSWVTMDEGATWTESDFVEDCTNYGGLFHAFVDKLIAEGDNTEDLSYTTDTASITISGVATNPTLDDSLFATS